MQWNTLIKKQSNFFSQQAVLTEDVVHKKGLISGQMAYISAGEHVIHKSAHAL